VSAAGGFNLPPGDLPEAARILRPGEKFIPRDEVRVVDPKTGGEKGSKLARFDLIPAGPLQALAEHFGRGARKYADRNWEKGYAWALSFAAMMRHAWTWWDGEDIDPETGSSHLTAVAWHSFALQEFQARGLGTDTRPHHGDEAQLEEVTRALVVLNRAWRGAPEQGALERALELAQRLDDARLKGGT
jgi:hypothetical protein